MRRAWCARFFYTDHEPFFCGTVVLEVTADFGDVMSALLTEWKKISPYPAPRMEPVPGLVFFKEESE